VSYLFRITDSHECVEGIVICPFCKNNGDKSQVFPGGSSQTLMANHEFFDEEGKHHFHDSNWTTTNFLCSKGHHWVSKTRSRCFCEGGGVEEQITRLFPKEAHEAKEPPSSDSVEVHTEYRQV